MMTQLIKKVSLAKKILASQLLTTLLLALSLVACSENSTNQPTEQLDEQATASKQASVALNNGNSLVRIEADFNQGWLFKLNDDQAFQAPEVNDASWRSLNLPHDWSVEHAFTQEKSDGATGYLPAGLGWYRKHFKTPDNGKNKHVLLFDGIYNHATVWINGEQIGHQYYGYSPFYYDLSKYLKPIGQENVIAVKVDRSRYIDSRWYTGSGIYRDVKLISTSDIHIPVWGTYVTTPEITEQQASVSLAIEINNASQSDEAIEVTSQIIDNTGQVVATAKSNSEANAAKTNTVIQNLTVLAPKRWDIDSPTLYKAVTDIRLNGKVIDQYVTPFGFRTIKFDNNKGFFLNGKSLKIKGVNLHHDAGLVGAAVPDDVWRRRLEKLKDAGVNAIRTAHNPASAAFMHLCDELGLLVQAEIFDEYDNPKDKRLNQQERHDDYISRGYTEHFQENGEQDLKKSVKRDRNHPSVIMWSIGNEIEWTYPRYAKATGYFDMNANGNYFFNPPFITPEEINQRFHTSEEQGYVLAKTAKKLSTWVKELDTTRPVTANLILPSVSHITGYTDALDIIGYSYRRVIYDYGHELFPDKMIMGTENVVQWHEWKAIEERDFIAGTFLWTGIDYMGESHNKWPVKATASGMLDLAGFDKPSFHMMKTLWHDQPHVYLATQTLEKSLYKLTSDNKVVEKKPGAWQRYVWYWHDVNKHWQYQPEQMIAVEVYSNCKAVELFLNGKSQGVKKLDDAPDHILKWAVPFSQGELIAKGQGDCTAQDELTTATSFAGINLSVDKSSLSNNYHHAAHIELQLTDKLGRAITFEDHSVSFEVTGPAHVMGVDNGSPSNVQDFQATALTTAKGRALMIIQATGQGDITVVAKSGNVISNKVVIKATKH
ncbi:MAG: glycoside hydrolase family 2 TIM barrel-domain containing protein [Thalassotalea sp.]